MQNYCHIYINSLILFTWTQDLFAVEPVVNLSQQTITRQTAASAVYLLWNVFFIFILFGVSWSFLRAAQDETQASYREALANFLFVALYWLIGFFFTESRLRIDF